MFCSIVDKHWTSKNILAVSFVDFWIRFALLSLYYCSWARQSSCRESNTSRLRVRWGTPRYYCCCAMCSCVWRTTLLEKEQSVQWKKKTLYTHRCLMCTILDGLVICLWLFFMLHLPLFGCWKFPCTLYWFSIHDVNCHTKLVGIVSGSKCWHREGHFLHSHALPAQCVSR